MDRFTWLLVGGVLALVAASLVTAAAARGRQTPPDLTTPAGVVLAYAQAEQRGDGSAAWELLAPSAQARGDRDRFIAHVTATPDHSRAYFTAEDEQREPDGQQTSVALVRTTPGSGGLLPSRSSSYTTTVRLKQADGQWRITVPPDDSALTLRRPR